MQIIEIKRVNENLSQRALAGRSGVSFRTVQLMEWGRHDARLSTLEKLAEGFGLPSSFLIREIENFFSLPADSVAVVSWHILKGGEKSWCGWLFNFVDAFRREKTKELIQAPPLPDLPLKLTALLASTVEALCSEMGKPSPSWCNAVPSLEKPWFVAGIENLKAMALVESPVYFRKRKLFVLGNFLDRK